MHLAQRLVVPEFLGVCSWSFRGRVGRLSILSAQLPGDLKTEPKYVLMLSISRLDHTRWRIKLQMETSLILCLSVWDPDPSTISPFD